MNAATLFLVAAEVLASPVQPLAENWLMERFEHLIPLGSERTVEVHNPYGDVRVRASGEDNVQSFAVAQRHRQDPRQPRIETRIEDGAIRVDVVYSPAAVAARPPLPLGAERRRVDIAAFVPPDATLRIETSSGFVESKGHRGHIGVRTTTGPIKIVTKGTVDAYSEHGDIGITFKSRKWQGASKLRTVTAKIHVAMIEYPDVLARVETAGEIATDYSVQIRAFPGSPFKKALARIGDASQELTIRSIKGAVKLERMFDMIPAGAGEDLADPASPLTPGHPYRKAELIGGP